MLEYVCPRCFAKHRNEPIFGSIYDDFCTYLSKSHRLTSIRAIMRNSGWAVRLFYQAGFSSLEDINIREIDNTLYTLKIMRKEAAANFLFHMKNYLITKQIVICDEKYRFFEKLFPRGAIFYTHMPIFGAYFENMCFELMRKKYQLSSIKTMMRQSHAVVKEFQNRGFQHIDEISLDDINSVWNYFLGNSCDCSATLISHLRNYLLREKILKPPKSVITNIDREWKLFNQYLETTVGLEKKTIKAYKYYLFSFWDYIKLNENKLIIQTLTVDDIYDFLILRCSHLSRYSKRHVIGYLRRYLIFLFFRGQISIPLHNMIYTPRIFREEKLPKALPWEVILKLCDSINRTTSLGCRDFAIMMLGVNYGLRGKEISDLTLDDIDWKNKTIKIKQSKTKNELLLPLSDAVAYAIIDYLKRERPHDGKYRNIFLRKRAPHTPLTSYILSDTFKRTINNSGLNVSHKNAHCLRHSFAMHMLRNKESFKTIGDLLGHKDPESTSSYIRLATDDMRCVPLEFPQKPVAWSRRDGVKKQEIPCRYHFMPQTKDWKLSSFLAESIKKYIIVKKSLGMKFIRPTRALYLFDRYLVTENTGQFVDQNVFEFFVRSLKNINLATKTSIIYAVINFLSYLKNTDNTVFCPEKALYTSYKKRSIAHILSSDEIGMVLQETSNLFITNAEFNYKVHVIRIGIALAYTCGLRLSEVINIRWQDIDMKNMTLFIPKTKFHKQRLIPIHESMREELHKYFSVMTDEFGISFTPEMAVVLSYQKKMKSHHLHGSTLSDNFSKICLNLGIITENGRNPRFHDLRHSFAVNALTRAYKKQEDLNAFMPLLSAYMGHVCINNTFDYLSFVKPLREAVNYNFEKTYGQLGLE